jgi:translocation and assembly module TamA
VLLTCLALGACARGNGLFGLLEPPAPLPETVPYEVVFEGELDEELRTALEASSVALSDVERPPVSEFLLAGRAGSDLPRLTQALRSLGFYEGSVDYRIEPPPPRPPPAERREPVVPIEAPVAPPPAVPPTRLIFEVEAGPRFELDAREIRVEGEPQGYTPPTPSRLGLSRGAPARAADVLAAERELIAQARREGRAFARAGPRSVVVDFERRTMDVTLIIEPGPEVRLAAPRFGGGAGVRDQFLRRRVLFREDSRFDPDEIEESRQSLLETNLFSNVRVDIAEELDADGRLPVTFRLTTRRHRTIGAGLGYVTDEGLNANLFWEHRNLFNGGELLRLDGYASPLRQEATARLRIPDVGARRQNIIANSALRFEDTDAFDSRSIGAGVGLERTFDPGYVGTLGVAYRFVSIEERGRDDQTFGLLSVPASFSWDRSDDLLDPTRGWRIRLDGAPFVDTLGIGRHFAKLQATHTRYFRLANRPRLVAAARGSLGSIVGASRADVPADERFYAGGGGSVRGIPFQKAGPLDNNNDPLGGVALLELSGELRWNVTESFGLVAFVDAGTVYDDPWPDVAEDIQVGTGLGLRYATPIGPLRLDVGVPVDRRRNVDDAFQLYISIGQAF